MASLTLRSVKGAPLTNNEIDTNFTNLDTELSTKLASADYNANDILTKLKTVDGASSGLDADTVDGFHPLTTNTANSIVLRDASGNFAAGTITAALLSGDILLQAGKTISFEGTVDNDFETILTVIDPTADRTISLPNTTGTIITTGDVGTVTNNMLAGSISNAKLSNSTITIDGITVALGGSVSILNANNIWVGLQTFTDDKFTVRDNTDNTKTVTLQLSNISSNTNRVLIVPDENGIIATQSHVETAIQSTGQNSQGTKTVSTSAPTGGSSGDIWYRV